MHIITLGNLVTLEYPLYDKKKKLLFTDSKHKITLDIISSKSSKKIVKEKEKTLMGNYHLG